MTIDREGTGPVWMQLADILRAEVERMVPGQILPSVRTLIQRFEVSENTVSHALAQLRGEGLITTYKGKGSYRA
jgi:DNA-binding GntR family transcriptional regulator